MSQVTNITVGYDRKRQPAQYESAGARVEFSAILSATVGDTEDHVSIATRLLGEAKTIVLTELGVVKPGESASAAARVAAPVAETGAPAPAAATAATGSRSRKPKDKPAEATGASQGASTASTAATGQPAAETTQQTTQNPDLPAEEFPGEGSGTAGAAAVNSDLPAETTGAAAATTAPAAGGAPTHNEIHNFIAEQIKGKKLDHAAVKAVSAKFKVARIADLTAEQTGSYLETIKQEIARLAGNPDITADL